MVLVFEGSEVKGLQGLGLPTKTYLFRRVPMNFILGFIRGTYKKVGFGSLR